MIPVELLNRQSMHSLRRNVRTRNLDRRIEVFENLLQSRVFSLLKWLLAFDYPVDNELLKLSSIEAFDQAIGQRLILWIGTFKTHEVRNRSKHPLASFLLWRCWSSSWWIPVAVSFPEVEFSVLGAFGFVWLRWGHSGAHMAYRSIVGMFWIVSQPRNPIPTIGYLCCARPAWIPSRRGRSSAPHHLLVPKQKVGGLRGPDPGQVEGPRLAARCWSVVWGQEASPPSRNWRFTDCVNWVNGGIFAFRHYNASRRVKTRPVLPD